MLGLELSTLGGFGKPLTASATVLGVGAMVLDMGLPDDLDHYIPIFYANCLSLMGV